MSLYTKFQEIFLDVPLELCDKTGKLLLKSPEMLKISKIMPEWRLILNNGLENDKEETYRTVRHTVRSIWVYFAIMNDRFKTNISKKNLKILKQNLERISQYHPDFFLLLLLFHDIGRPFDRESHNLESAKIILQQDLLKNCSIMPIQKIVLTGVIKYHLLPGTIFAGESNYCGAISLLNDDYLQDMWSIPEIIDIFFRALMIFTIIDIWGYNYSKIFNHYFSYYNQIRENLTEGFKKLKLVEKEDRVQHLFQFFAQFDKENLKWRVSCALRIFQFINVRPYLTREFFYSKIDETLNLIGQDWTDFVESLGNEHIYIQFKYTLPVMMVLAAGEFKRKPLEKEGYVLSNIFTFWQTCIKNIKKFKENSASIPTLWHFNFELPPGWFIQQDYLNYVMSDEFFKTIEKATPLYDAELKCYIVNIKFFR